MLHKGKFRLFVFALSLAFAISMLAAAPVEGLVVEGVSVPGAAIGDTRAEIESAFGSPVSCRNAGTTVQNGSCAYAVDGGGSVQIGFYGPDGGAATNSPDDVAGVFQWGEKVSGWTTAVGINTAIAKADPDAVVAAYPNAVLTYTNWGTLFSAIDYEQGIRVNWQPNIYAGTVSVTMTISRPSEPPPPRIPKVVVAEIDLSSRKTKGTRIVTAFVKVEDDRTFAAYNATVSATWVLPDGSTLDVVGSTSNAGWAYFEINPAERGTYTLLINEVSLEDYIYQPENSVLTASIKVK